MEKKIISLLLIIAMVAVTSLAFAENPSPQRPGPIMGVTVVSYMTVSGDSKDTAKTETGKIILEEAADEPGVVESILTGIREASEEDTLLDFFGEDVLEQTEVTLNNPILSEFWIIKVEGAPQGGDVSFDFPEDFQNGDPIIILIGLANADETITWVNVPVTVDDKQIVVSFSEEVLAAIKGNSTAVLAVLQEKAD